MVPGYIFVIIPLLFFTICICAFFIRSRYFKRRSNNRRGSERHASNAIVDSMRDSLRMNPVVLQSEVSHNPSPASPYPSMVYYLRNAVGMSVPGVPLAFNHPTRGDASPHLIIAGAGNAGGAQYPVAIPVFASRTEAEAYRRFLERVQLHSDGGGDGDIDDGMSQSSSAAAASTTSGGGRVPAELLYGSPTRYAARIVKEIEAPEVSHEAAAAVDIGGGKASKSPLDEGEPLPGGEGREAVMTMVVRSGSDVLSSGPLSPPPPAVDGVTARPKTAGSSSSLPVGEAKREVQQQQQQQQGDEADDSSRPQKWSQFFSAMALTAEKDEKEQRRRERKERRRRRRQLRGGGGSGATTATTSASNLMGSEAGCDDDDSTNPSRHYESQRSGSDFGGGGFSPTSSQATTLTEDGMSSASTLKGGGVVGAGGDACSHASQGGDDQLLDENPSDEEAGAYQGLQLPRPASHRSPGRHQHQHHHMIPPAGHLSRMGLHSSSERGADVSGLPSSNHLAAAGASGGVEELVSANNSTGTEGILKPASRPVSRRLLLSPAMQNRPFLTHTSSPPPQPPSHHGDGGGGLRAGNPLDPPSPSPQQPPRTLSSQGRRKDGVGGSVNVMWGPSPTSSPAVSAPSDQQQQLSVEGPAPAINSSVLPSPPRTAEGGRKPASTTVVVIGDGDGDVSREEDTSDSVVVVVVDAVVKSDSSNTHPPSFTTSPPPTVIARPLLSRKDSAMNPDSLDEVLEHLPGGGSSSSNVLHGSAQPAPVEVWQLA